MKTIGKKRTTHNNQVQFLRGIFCISLVLYHYTCRYSQIYIDNSYYVEFLNILGNASLSGFLVLSGYFFNNPEKEITPKSFVVSKIKRLYPEYLIAIIIIYIVSLTGLLGPDRQISFIDFLANIPMVNVFININYVDGAHWYVTFLLAMTIFFSVLILLRIEKKIFTWLFSSCIWMVITLLLLWKFPSLYEKFRDYIRYYILFTVGVAYRIYHVDNKKANKVLFFSTIILNCILIVLLKDFLYLLCVMSSSVFIGMAVNNKLQALNYISPVIAIGDMSYLIYLLHQNIGYCIINYLKNTLNLPVAFNVIFALSIILLLSYTITIIKRIGGKNDKKAA